MTREARNIGTINQKNVPIISDRQRHGPVKVRTIVRFLPNLEIKQVNHLHLEFHLWLVYYIFLIYIVVCVFTCRQRIDLLPLDGRRERINLHVFRQKTRSLSFADSSHDINPEYLAFWLESIDFKGASRYIKIVKEFRIANW